MPKFKKRPVVIEAEQFTQENKNVAFTFIQCTCAPTRDKYGNPTIDIQTKEGVMTAKLGDWIIKGVEGEFYPCDPSIFEKTYEQVDDNTPVT